MKLSQFLINQTMNLVHIIYCSSATKMDFSPLELEELLLKSRVNNARIGISGILLFNNGSFFQVLEGEKETVEALYEKISKDKRHDKTTKIIMEPIKERSFSVWTMGYPDISTDDLENIPGLNDFFTSGNSYLELGECRAKTLLNAFKEGRWRTTIF
jgi:hypothetical protein